MDTNSQKQKIINYCKEHGSCTIRELFCDLMINNPTARISEIRKNPRYKVTFMDIHNDPEDYRYYFRKYFIWEVENNA